MFLDISQNSHEIILDLQFLKNKEGHFLYVSATKLFKYYSGKIKMRSVNYCYLGINILSYLVLFIKKINLLHLRHWSFPGKFMNFSEAAAGLF